LTAERYEIRVEGHLDRSWRDWFGGMAMRHEPNGDTLLRGPVEDQAALHGILARLRNLNLKLISITLCGAESEPAGNKEEGRRD
jgi:hypothetical protein